MPIITIVILVNSHQNKAKQVKTRHDEIYIDPLHIKIMTMTTTMTIIMTMTIIIQ